MIVAGLGFETLLLGVATTWLLALVPTAVVTVLKGRWPLFLAGWLTLGITWLIGAASLALPDSWWARRVYDEKQLARAKDPLRHPRPRRAIALWSAGTVAAIVLVGLFAARPSPILGVEADALQDSVGGWSPGLSTRPCQPRGNRTWNCERYDDQSSDSVGYRVKVDGLGCWTATRIGPPGEGSDKRLSGCITIVDHVFG
jgi:hypothetical protein